MRARRISFLNAVSVQEHRINARLADAKAGAAPALSSRAPAMTGQDEILPLPHTSPGLTSWAAVVKDGAGEAFRQRFLDRFGWRRDWSRGDSPAGVVASVSVGADNGSIPAQLGCEDDAETRRFLCHATEFR